MGIELFIWLQILQKFMVQLANLDQVKMGFSLLSAFYYTFSILGPRIILVLYAKAHLSFK